MSSKNVLETVRRKDVLKFSKELSRSEMLPNGVLHTGMPFGADQVATWQKELGQLKFKPPASVFVFGKWRKEPRQALTFGEEGLTYKYSGKQCRVQPIRSVPVLMEIREAIMEKLRVIECYKNIPDFNFVVVNKYRDGKDCIGAHSDDEKELEPGMPIVSLSIGATRRFVFHTKKPNRVIGGIQLVSGAVVVMGANVQENYNHSVPKATSVLDERINLTFRVMKNN